MKGATSAVAAATSTPMVVPSSVLGKGNRAAPSERGTIGVIGLGAMGSADLGAMLNLKDTQIVALCDVDTFHYRENESRKGRAYGLDPAKIAVEGYYGKASSKGTYQGCNTYSDYRELCARDDINHWVLGLDGRGPLSVEAVGWKFPETKIYNTPMDYEIRCEYPNDIEVSIASGHKSGIKWIGGDGSWIYVTRGKLEASKPEWVTKDYDTGSKKAYKSPGHHRNFVDGVKSRKECVAPAETAHRSVTPGHLGYISQTLGRKLNWDAGKEQIGGDAAAQKLLMETPYVGDWKLAQGVHLALLSKRFP